MPEQTSGDNFEGPIPQNQGQQDEVTSGDYGEQDSVQPVTENQKRIFIAFALFSLMVLGFLSRRVSSGIENLQAPPTPVATATPKPKITYRNEMTGMSFVVPDGWIVETPGSTSFNFITLRPLDSASKCFPDTIVCPIVIEVRQNPQNLAPNKFGSPFFPVAGDIWGGQDDINIGGLNGIVLYNIGGAGGRIVYIIRTDDIVRISLRKGSESVMGQVTDVFDKLLKSINFSQ